MLLLIDAGNTRIKWAIPATLTTPLATLPRWRHAGSLSHAELDQLGPALQGLAITGILVSNVAGAELKARIASQLQLAAPQIQPEWFASSEQAAGLRNAYRHPAQLGCDRFAAAIAAHALYPAHNLIVATCGTATTIDAISADGVFRGGMILPGLKLMAQSLAKNTAQLPQVAESISLEHLFADHTETAIVSGCINAQVGAIERAVARWKIQQQQDVICLISGGAATYLLPHLGISCQHVDNLVLTGLALAASAAVDMPVAHPHSIHPIAD
ncbi:type III pantothenate kinase [Undibacterium sp. Jales W-56]|uniref:type III pantothenate kinase n=1 Tax=Undibacterium sp. Jales W-56 TaxID=2897325 RepID=UPI0021CF34CC|nr:type III pantothenate kinase [Undibacterium sp. Jales W-56]MCU6435718.1 type III pantothenate kinase [Undibacterium sp. Jales W-56]